MSVRRSLWVLLVVTFLLPALIFTRQPGGTARETQERLQNLQLYEVRRNDVELSVSAIGTLAAEQTISLSFLTAGRVSKLYVQRDDYVLAGDVLAGLDNTAQRIAYDQALLQLERARLDLQDTMQVDENTLRIAQAAVDTAWGSYLSLENAVSDGDIQSAQLAYQQAQEAYNAAIRSRNDIGGQFGGDSPEWDLANARVGEASFNVEIARLQIDQLRTQTQPGLNAAYQRVIQAQRELERVQAGATPFEIEAAEIAIEQAEGQVERARTNFDRTILTAPFDGVVSSLNIEVGALVGPGLSIIEMADVSPLQLQVLVDEIDINIIDVGMPVRVELDALPDVEIPARLVSIAPIGTNVGGIVNYEVDIELQAEDPRARAGMTAEATVIVEDAPDVLTVPNPYIRLDRRTGQAFVNVLRESENDETFIEEVEVQIGLQGQESSEIVTGLQEGDLIAIDLRGESIIGQLLGG